MALNSMVAPSRSISLARVKNAPAAAAVDRVVNTAAAAVAIAVTSQTVGIQGGATYWRRLFIYACADLLPAHWRLVVADPMRFQYLNNLQQCVRMRGFGHIAVGSKTIGVPH